MDYVIFDLEWNQCPYGKGKENPKLPFEIIEIGAVKMDGERNVLGTFHRIVKPVVYQHLHHRTREVVGLTEEDLQNGIPFAQAVQEFFAFSGGACMFGTWGPGDLTELQRNMKFYNLLSLIRGPIHFYDVQKLFAIQYETMKSRRALEYAADFLHLPKDEHFHQALSDAKYTADIFARIDMDVVLAYDSIDVYQNPKSKKEEIHAVYNGYTKFISREFDTKEEAMHDREVCSTHCCICGKTVPVSVLPPTTAPLVSRRSSVRFPNRIFLLMVRTPFLPPGTGICLSFPAMTARRFRRSACSTSIPFRSLVSAGGASGMTPQFLEMMSGSSTATTMISTVCRITA